MLLLMLRLPRVEGEVKKLLLSLTHAHKALEGGHRHWEALGLGAGLSELVEQEAGVTQLRRVQPPQALHGDQTHASLAGTTEQARRKLPGVERELHRKAAVGDNDRDFLFFSIDSAFTTSKTAFFLTLVAQLGVHHQLPLSRWRSEACPWCWLEGRFDDGANAQAQYQTASWASQISQINFAGTATGTATPSFYPQGERKRPALG